MSPSLHLSADVSVGFSCYLDVFGDVVQKVHEAHVGTLDVVEAGGESFRVIHKPPTHPPTHTHFHRYITAALRRQADQWHHCGIILINPELGFIFAKFDQEASTAASLEGGEVNEGQEAKPEELKLVEVRDWTAMFVSEFFKDEFSSSPRDIELPYHAISHHYITSLSLFFA